MCGLRGSKADYDFRKVGYAEEGTRRSWKSRKTAEFTGTEVLSGAGYRDITLV